MFLIFTAEAVLLAGLIHEGVLRGLGHEVTGQLISIHERKDSDGSYSHVARYRYALPGGLAREDESLLSWSAWLRLRKPFITSAGSPNDIVFPTTAPSAEAAKGAGELGVKSPQTIQILAYALGPAIYSRAVEHEWGFMFWLIPAIFVPTLGLLCWALYLALVVRPRRVRWLYTDGPGVVGQIFEKRRWVTKYGVVRLVYYVFRPAGESADRVGQVMVAGEEELATATPGKQVLVLYDPARPKRNTVYEYGGYVWE